MSLRRLELRYCFGVAAGCLADAGRLTALEHLALIGLPGASGDGGMQQLAPRLHTSLSSLHFTGFTEREVESCAS